MKVEWKLGEPIAGKAYWYAYHNGSFYATAQDNVLPDGHIIDHDLIFQVSNHQFLTHADHDNFVFSMRKLFPDLDHHAVTAALDDSTTVDSATEHSPAKAALIKAINENIHHDSFQQPYVPVQYISEELEHARSEADAKELVEAIDLNVDTIYDQPGVLLQYIAEEMNYARGGRLKSALNRDRKYTSEEEWEKNYKRTGRRKFYRTMEDGGDINESKKTKGIVKGGISIDPYLYNRDLYISVHIDGVTYGGKVDSTKWLRGATEGQVSKPLAIIVWDEDREPQNSSEIELIVNDNIDELRAIAEDNIYSGGGRLKSALNRDRKYTSEEEWEKNYKRAGHRKFYRTMEDGGDPGQTIQDDDFEDFIDEYDKGGIVSINRIHQIKESNAYAFSANFKDTEITGVVEIEKKNTPTESSQEVEFEFELGDQELNQNEIQEFKDSIIEQINAGRFKQMKDGGDVGINVLTKKKLEAIKAYSQSNIPDLYDRVYELQLAFGDNYAKMKKYVAEALDQFHVPQSNFVIQSKFEQGGDVNYGSLINVSGFQFVGMAPDIVSARSAKQNIHDQYGDAFRVIITREPESGEESNPEKDSFSIWKTPANPIKEQVYKDGGSLGSYLFFRKLDEKPFATRKEANVRLAQLEKENAKIPYAISKMSGEFYIMYGEKDFLERGGDVFDDGIQSSLKKGDKFIVGIDYQTPSGKAGSTSIVVEIDDPENFMDEEDVIDHAESIFKEKHKGYKIVGGDIVQVNDSSNDEEFSRGGRLKSALNRDRKYTSEEEWEKNYKRAGRRKFYRTMEDGGDLIGTWSESIQGIVENFARTGSREYYDQIRECAKQADRVATALGAYKNVGRKFTIERDGKKIQAIDITPTWEGIFTIPLTLYTQNHGSKRKNAADLRKKAIDQLKQMAEVADREGKFLFGGRLKSALNRDRKYTSEEEWEKNYKRAGRRKFYRTMEDGGMLESINEEIRSVNNRLKALEEINTEEAYRQSEILRKQKASLEALLLHHKDDPKLQIRSVGRVYYSGGGDLSPIKEAVDFKFSEGDSVKILQVQAKGKLVKEDAVILERLAAEQPDGTFYPFYYVRIGNLTGKVLYAQDELIERHGNKPKLAEGGDIRSRCPEGTEIQTLILSKDKFSKEQAKKWAVEHGFTSRLSTIDETANNWRLRQSSPSRFEKNSFRTITLKDGEVQAVIACPKNK